MNILQTIQEITERAEWSRGCLIVSDEQGERRYTSEPIEEIVKLESQDVPACAIVTSVTACAPSLKIDYQFPN